MRARLVVRPKAGTVPANDRLRAPTGQCGPRHASDDIVMQLAISFAGILLMMGVAGLLAWYKANNAMHSDAATVESTNSEAQRRSVVGIGSTGELTTAIARFAVRATLRAVANIGPQARIGIMMTDSADETRRARWNREAA